MGWKFRQPTRSRRSRGVEVGVSPGSLVATAACSSVLWCHGVSSASTSTGRLESRHLAFEFYQDYSGSRENANDYLLGLPVKLLEVKSRRFDFQELVSGLDGGLQQRCIVGDERTGSCKPFRAYNPSIIAAEGGGFWVLARASNWSLCSWNGQGRPYSDFPDTKYPNAVFEEYHSHLLVQRLGPRLELQGHPRHVTMDPQTWSRTRSPFFEIFRQGLEDPRLLELPSGVLALVSYGSPKGRKQPTRLAPKGTGVSAFRQALVAFGAHADNLSTADALPPEAFVPMLAAFDADEQQKNWMPLVYQGKLFAMHQIAPLQQVLQVNATSGATYLDFENPAPEALENLLKSRASIRGGTQAIFIPEHNIYLAIAHVSRGRTMYTHFFLALEVAPPFHIIAVSREWCLAHKEDLGNGPELLCEGVQFVSGLAKDGNRLLLTYGVQDCDARLATVPLASAVKSLKYIDEDRKQEL